MNTIMLPSIVDTKRTHFIIPNPSYLPEFSRIAGDQNVMKYITTGARSQAEAKAELNSWKSHWENEGFGPYLVISKQGKELIGFAKLYRSNRCPEINLGYILDRPYWGQGLGKEIAKTCLELAFYHLELPRIVAFARIENMASRHILEKLGFSCNNDNFCCENRVYAQYGLMQERYFQMQQMRQAS